MTTKSRTRRPAAAPAAEETPATPAVDETPAAPPVDEAPAIPAAGALEPPAEDAPAQDEKAPEPINAGEVGIERAIAHRHGLLIDEVTNQPPDPDALFAQEEGPGSTYICTVRLSQVLNPGEDWSSSIVLVMPRGLVVTKERAEQLIELVRQQRDGDALEPLDLLADTPQIGVL